MKDAFNLTCLPELNLPKARFSQCKALMHRNFAPTEEELQNEQFVALNTDASDLYGSVHARYIRSPEGKYSVRKLIKLFKFIGLAIVYGKYL